MLEPLPNEKWTILDKEKEYMISNFGRCYSIKTNKILKPMINNKGYLRYHIRHFDKESGQQRKMLLAHIAVVSCFGDRYGNKEIPEGSDIDHIDRNKFHNTSDNLEIVSHQENMKRRYIVEKPDYDDEIFGIFY